MPLSMSYRLIARNKPRVFTPNLQPPEERRLLTGWLDTYASYFPDFGIGENTFVQ